MDQLTDVEPREESSKCRKGRRLACVVAEVSTAPGLDYEMQTFLAEVAIPDLEHCGALWRLIRSASAMTQTLRRR
jgi:hypothetical protein